MAIGAHGLPGHLVTNNVAEEVKQGQDNATILHQPMAEMAVLVLPSVKKLQHTDMLCKWMVHGNMMIVTSKQERLESRICNNPTPQNGGLPCAGFQQTQLTANLQNKCHSSEDK